MTQQGGGVGICTENESPTLSCLKHGAVAPFTWNLSPGLKHARVTVGRSGCRRRSHSGPCPPERVLACSRAWWGCPGGRSVSTPGPANVVCPGAVAALSRAAPAETARAESLRTQRRQQPAAAECKTRERDGAARHWVSACTGLVISLPEAENQSFSNTVLFERQSTILGCYSKHKKNYSIYYH
jgi:hypothetical protein